MKVTPPHPCGPVEWQGDLDRLRATRSEQEDRDFQAIARIFPLRLTAAN